MESGESRSAGYYCHKCNLTVQVPSTDLCPLCNDGFIEKLNPYSSSSLADRNNDLRDDIDSLPAVLRHVSDNFEVIVQGGDSSQGSFSDHRPSSSNRRDASSDAAQGNDRRRTRNQNYANSFEHVFSELLNTMTRPNAANLDGNAPLFLLSNPPGDYAWGREGLDTIVTQLLNQMDSSGPPPLSNDKIEAIPFVVVTDAQVSENTQCSVCWESFKQAENVRQLPCEHIYHDACILPWLQLHGTCPICRKLLCDDNDSRLGFSHTGNLEALFSNVQRFSIYPTGGRRNANRRRRNSTGAVRNPHIRCWRCSELGHYARSCHLTRRTNRTPSSQRVAAAEPRRTPQNGGAGDGVAALNEMPSVPFATFEANPPVDIDDLDEDEDEDDDDDDLYDGYSEFSDFEYETAFSDIDFDVLSFSGASSGSAHQQSWVAAPAPSAARTGWPSLAATTSASFGEAHPRRFPCYACGRLGHKANECRANRRAALASALRSYNERCTHCGRTNHTTGQCFFRLATPRNVGDCSPLSTAADLQPTARPRYRSPPPPYPRRVAGRLAARASATSQLQTTAGVLRTSSPQSRLRSPPPPRLTSPLQDTFHRSTLTRLLDRGAVGSSIQPPSAGFGRRAAMQPHPRRDRLCYRCNQPGHVSRDCPSRNLVRECWQCGETGHLRRDCPLLM